ncbi:GNAT family N-acetyltransferase [Oceanobacillus polygoni]|uniref:GNAT family acetyltransferase n=1 Tax=Oceanobacillus polygoni TaxID=1235259 RepID=A0A9X0YWQ6_9BACI|nr:GNAT family N-acetyltransferase [Oceanobacillus polygoni]MBP2078740.1 putative GNAT family acetyltransferase [Oceanobacillus polygoni]
MTTINKGENKFYVGDNIKEPLAEITFIQIGDAKIVIDHTYVSDELRGQGIAGELVEKVVLFAREKNRKITPLCPYAKKKIENTPEFCDVLGV